MRLPAPKEAAGWFGEQGIDVPDEPRRKASVVTVFERTTKREYRIDKEAEPKWGPIEYGDDWNGIEGFYNFTNIETVCRRSKRFILLFRREHFDIPIADEGAEFLSDQAAVDWLIRNGFDAPADVAHLATIRSIDKVTDEEIEAARQREAANAQLTPDEELELLFPTGCASTAKPATDQAEPPVADEAARAKALDIEAAIAEAAARNVTTPPDIQQQLDNLFGRAGKQRKVNKAEADKLADKYFAQHPWPEHPWPGYRKLADAINYFPSRVGELPSVKRFLKQHPEALPARSPKTGGISKADEASMSVGERHGVLNALAAKDEAEHELQRLAGQRCELQRAEERLAELARATAEQVGEMRRDNAAPKFMGKPVGRRRKA